MNLITNLDGWIIIDKPKKIGSTDVVNKLKRALRPKKIGHAGTLDPFATGMLLIAVGEATKTVAYAMSNIKDYEFTLRFGSFTDSYDEDGQVIEESSNHTTESEFKKIAESYVGTYEQVPPKFSAIKIDGKRAYDLARNGEDFEIKSRSVELHSFELLEFTENYARAKITCGKGFYVRSLAYDICKKLNICGHLTELRRTRIGNFHEQHMISLSNFEELGYNDSQELRNSIHPVHAVLDDILVQQVLESEVTALKQGKKLKLELPDGLVACMFEGKLISISEVQSGQLSSLRVFNL